MQREVDWIIEALARDPTKTKAGLAAALMIDKSGISRLLRGKRRLKFKEAQKAAEYLGMNQNVCAPSGFAEPGDDYTPRLAACDGEEISPSPIYGCEMGEGGMWRLDRSSVVERRERAPQFAGAELVFGLYAPDASMAPRIFAGETIWVNPARIAAIGRDALIMRHDSGERDIEVFLCRLNSSDGVRLSGSQYGSNKTREFASKEWRALHIYGRE